MHNIETVELAAFVSVHARPLIADPVTVTSSGVEQYWTASKCRLERWSRTLKRYEAFSPPGGPPAPCRRRDENVAALLEEVLAGEVLTRLWSAVLWACDRTRGTSQFEPLGESVLLAHLEVRQRALKALLHAPGVQVQRAMSLNRLRKRAERWTDLLLARLLPAGDVGRYANDPARAREFAAELHAAGGEQAESGNTAWRVLHASLLRAFKQALESPPANPDLNQRIASGVLCCFPGELFDSTGPFHSLWTTRLFNATHDAEDLLAALGQM